MGSSAEVWHLEGIFVTSALLGAGDFPALQCARQQPTANSLLPQLPELCPRFITGSRWCVHMGLSRQEL